MFLIAIVTLWLCRTVSGMPRCYPSDSPLLPAVAADCASIVDMMLEGDKRHAPMHFSRKPGRGFQVPHRWVNSTCVVVIDLVGDEEDTMSMWQIAMAATWILNLCVGRPGRPSLGGREYTGPKDAMLVLLAGRTKRDPYGRLTSGALRQPGLKKTITSG